MNRIVPEEIRVEGIPSAKLYSFILKDGRGANVRDKTLLIDDEPIVTIDGSWTIGEQSNDGRFLYIHMNSTIAVVDIEKRKVVSIPAHSYNFPTLFGPPGLIYRINDGWDIYRYDDTGIRLINNIRDKAFNNVNQMIFNGGNKLILLKDERVDVWDTKTFEWMRKPMGPESGSEHFKVKLLTPTVFLVYSFRRYEVYDINTLNLIYTHPTSRHGVIFPSPDGKITIGFTTENISQLKIAPTMNRPDSDGVKWTAVDTSSCKITEKENLKVFDFGQSMWVRVTGIGQYGYAGRNYMFPDGTRIKLEFGLTSYNVVFPHGISPVPVFEHIFHLEENGLNGRDKWIRLMSDFTLETDETWPRSLIKIDLTHPQVAFEVARRFLKDTPEPGILVLPIVLLVLKLDVKEYLYQLARAIAKAIMK